jgi:hypothetical protein
MTQSTKKNNKIIWIALAGVFVIVSIVCIYKKSLISAYVHNFKYNHYKQGDEMYISRRAIDTVSKYETELHRYVKDNNSGDLFIFPTKDTLDKKKILKNPKISIGKYIGTLFYSYTINGTIHTQRLYSLIPNKEALLNNNGTIVADKLPGGLVYVDDKLYLDADLFDNN